MVGGATFAQGEHGLEANAGFGVTQGRDDLRGRRAMKGAEAQ